MLAKWKIIAIGFENFWYHGAWPVNISMIVHPRLHISAFSHTKCSLTEFPIPRATSGAIQCGVPIAPSSKNLEKLSLTVRRFERGVNSCSVVAAVPKSASLIMPVGVSSRLPPLMSRCAMPLLCKYFNPARICLVYTITTLSLNGPNRRSKPAIEPPTCRHR